MTTIPSSESSPTLWNPKAAAVWCLLFSPAFGAYLHARNAETLGRPEEAKANRMWFFISLAYFGVILISVFFPAIPDQVFRLGALGLLFGWHFSVGRKQIEFVRENYQDQYQRKPWAKPLLIAFGCVVALMGVIIGLTMFTTPLDPDLN